MNSRLGLPRNVGCNLEGVYTSTTKRYIYKYMRIVKNVGWGELIQHPYFDKDMRVRVYRWLTYIKNLKIQK